jgi:hypothetical protein
MISFIVRRLVLIITCIVMIFTIPAIAQSPGPLPSPRVQPAIDGIMAAFANHPIIGISDNHGLAQEADFYAALIRDPRFAKEVGNVVVEFGGAAGQPIIDLYVNGEPVPYSELRKVWTQVVGWIPTVTPLGYMNFYAQVRATNLTLPPEQRIHVWLGEPEIDWTKIKTQADVVTILDTRESHAADVIKHEILSQKKKALVIYGGAHFSRTPLAFGPMPPLPTCANADLIECVEREYPNSFFLVSPYSGYEEKACSDAIEKSFQNWPMPALATPLRDGALANQLMQNNCHFLPREALSRMTITLPPSATAEQQARARARMQHLTEEAERLLSGVDSDALLYLGPAASLTRAPIDPDIYLDEDYRAEINRQMQLRPPGQGRPLPPIKMEYYAVTPSKWRQY